MRFYFVLLLIFAVYVSGQPQESDYEGDGVPKAEEMREKRQCLGNWAECNEDFGSECCAGYGCHQPLNTELGNCRPMRY